MSPIYDTDSYEPRKGVGYLVNRVRTELLAALDRALAADRRLAALELSAAQYVIVATLAMASGPTSAAELCKGMSYDAGAMTRMLDRLEAKGLLHRKRCGADRRIVFLELTDAGRAAFPRMREISVGVLNGLLAGFTRTEARALEAYLARMLENARSLQG